MRTRVFSILTEPAALVGNNLRLCARACVCARALSQRSIPASGHFMQHVNDPGSPREPLLFIDCLFMRPIQVQTSATTGCCSAGKRARSGSSSRSHVSHAGRERSPSFARERPSHLISLRKADWQRDSETLCFLLLCSSCHSCWKPPPPTHPAPPLRC